MLRTTAIIAALLAASPALSWTTCPEAPRPTVGDDERNFAQRTRRNETLIRLYDLDRANRVLSAGTCSCALWKPSYTAALTTYQADFAHLRGREFISATDGLADAALTVIADAVKVCSELRIR